MDNKKIFKTVAIVGGSAFGAFVAYKIIKKVIDRNNIGKEDPIEESTPSTGGGSPSANTDWRTKLIPFPLKLDDRGYKVYRVQKALNVVLAKYNKLDERLDEDGILGNGTKAAIYKLESLGGLPISKVNYDKLMDAERLIDEVI